LNNTEPHNIEEQRLGTENGQDADARESMDREEREENKFAGKEQTDAQTTNSKIAN
jgi:hypothetical protein